MRVEENGSQADKKRSKESERTWRCVTLETGKVGNYDDKQPGVGCKYIMYHEHMGGVESWVIKEKWTGGWMDAITQRVEWNERKGGCKALY
jgi:hypothetical protein